MRDWSVSRGIWRGKWLFVFLALLMVFFAFVTVPNTTGRLIVYKLMLAIAAAIVGHIIVKALYPYIDLKKLLEEDKADESCDATKFMGACILRALVMAAVIVGVLVGI